MFLIVTGCFFVSSNCLRNLKLVQLYYNNFTLCAMPGPPNGALTKACSEQLVTIAPSSHRPSPLGPYPSHLYNYKYHIKCTENCYATQRRQYKRLIGNSCTEISNDFRP